MQEELKINLLIVEDQQIIIDGLTLILSSVPIFGDISACIDTEKLIQTISEKKPDVILLDFNMPEMDGIICLVEILKVFPQQKVLMLTGYDDTELIREALRKGAKGYILKNIAKDELINAIKIIYSGNRYLDQQVQNKVVEAFIHSHENKSNSTDSSSHDTYKLSSREKEVLKLIAEGKPSAKISEILFISVNTVDTHRKNIMAKCGVKKITELINFANKNNLI